MVVAPSSAAHARQLGQARRGLRGLVLGLLRPLRDRQRLDDARGRKGEQSRARELLLLLPSASSTSSSAAVDEDDLGEPGEPALAERTGGLDVGPAADARVAEAFFFFLKEGGRG